MSSPTAYVSGRILHTQRFSTEDGPGLRTTVFFKGCPLRCRWCHNPESISPRSQMQWLENRCMGCGSCLEACQQGALSRTAGGLQRDRTLCLACGACAEACPANAHELLGKDVSAEGLAQELLKDRAYFEKSGGGVTLSGGEPTRQPEFALDLAARLKAAGLSVALDTCGLCMWEDLESLLPYVDVILYDLKMIDPVLHRVWTGASNRLILENFQQICTVLPQRFPQTVLWVRTPLIPVSTTTEGNLRALGEFLAENLNRSARRWELCAFNNLCRDKYRRLGMDWEFGATPLLTAAEAAQAAEWARLGGVDPGLIHVTGAVQAV